MSKKNLYVKIDKYWYRATDMCGVDCENGEVFSSLFLDHIEDVRICGEGEVFQKQAQQQEQAVDYNAIRIEMAKAYIQAYGEQTYEHSSNSFAEKAFNFANEFVKKLIENPINS
jgi:hypothetical protein